MDTIGDRIQAGDMVVCKAPDPTGRLAEGRRYTVKAAFTADRRRILKLVEMPNVEWDASRFAKAPPNPYGWVGGYP